MTARHCTQCGYDLSGLPATGTVVTCPECAHATDLSVPFLGRVSTFAPYLWGMVPAIACAVLRKLYLLAFGRDRWDIEGLAIYFGVFGGAATTGILMYEMLRREPEAGCTLRPLWVRLALSMCAALATVFINGVFVASLGYD